MKRSKLHPTSFGTDNIFCFVDLRLGVPPRKWHYLVSWPKKWCDIGEEWRRKTSEFFHWICGFIANTKSLLGLVEPPSRSPRGAYISFGHVHMRIFLSTFFPASDLVSPPIFCIFVKSPIRFDGREKREGLEDARARTRATSIWKKVAGKTKNTTRILLFRGLYTVRIAWSSNPLRLIRGGLPRNPSYLIKNGSTRDSSSPYE